MTDSGKTDHWRSLLNLLGAGAADEPAPPVETPATTPPAEVQATQAQEEPPASVADEAPEAQAPPSEVRSFLPAQKTAAAKPKAGTPPKRTSHWYNLAAGLGLDVPPPEPEPEPEPEPPAPPVAAAPPAPTPAPPADRSVAERRPPASTYSRFDDEPIDAEVVDLDMESAGSRGTPVEPDDEAPRSSADEPRPDSGPRQLRNRPPREKGRWGRRDRGGDRGERADRGDRGERGDREERAERTPAESRGAREAVDERPVRETRREVEAERGTDRDAERPERSFGRGERRPFREERAERGPRSERRRDEDYLADVDADERPSPDFEFVDDDTDHEEPTGPVTPKAVDEQDESEGGNRRRRRRRRRRGGRGEGRDSAGPDAAERGAVERPRDFVPDDDLKSPVSELDHEHDFVEPFADVEGEAHSDRPESSEEGREGGGRRRRRRRRRRGGRDSRGPAREGDRHEAGTSSTTGRRRDESLPVDADADADLDDLDELDVVPRRPADVRRRDDEDLEAFDDDELHDLGDPYGESRGDEGLEDEEDADHEGDAVHHRNTPTWDETVGILIQANMENRSRNPSGNYRGRGGGRGGRGGRGDRGDRSDRGDRGDR